jgi:hypothetical protein
MTNQASLKALMRHMVNLAGGAKAAAGICGAHEAEISYWSNDQHDRFIPVDHLTRLDQACDDLFLKEWARSRGFELTPREPAGEMPARVIAIMGHFAKEAGELGAIVLDAAEDNHFTPTEVRLIRDSIAPVKDLISALEKAIGG